MSIKQQNTITDGETDITGKNPDRNGDHETKVFGTLYVYRPNLEVSIYLTGSHSINVSIHYLFNVSYYSVNYFTNITNKQTNKQTSCSKSIS
jgi:hypothetical protein